MPGHWTTHKVNRGATIRLADLPPGVSVLTGYIFEDCIIRGPAVVTSLTEGVLLEAAEVVSPAKGLFVELPPDVKPAGVIGLRNCVFRRCRFELVSIAGTAEDIRDFRRTLTPRKSIKH